MEGMGFHTLGGVYPVMEDYLGANFSAGSTMEALAPRGNGQHHVNVERLRSSRESLR